MNSHSHLALTSILLTMRCVCRPLALSSDRPFGYGLVKLDVTAEPGKAVVDKIMVPEDHTIGEPLFVPRDEEALKARQCAEDDGYLITYGANIKTGKSYCVVRRLQPVSSSTNICPYMGMAHDDEFFRCRNASIEPVHLCVAMYTDIHV